jgi:hypothetical protein
MVMPRCTLAGVVVVLLALTGSSLLARDPGDTAIRAGAGGSDSSGRVGTTDRFVPERIEPSELHPPSHLEPREPPLYQRVESDVDRGKGRVEDERTLNLRRREEDLDLRPGHYPQADIARERQRLQEDIDRRQRLDKRAIEAEDRKQLAETMARDAAAAAKRAGRPEPVPQPMGSVLTRHVAQESKRLEAARQKYQSDLATAETEREEAIRTAPTREAKAEAARRFDRRRLELTQAYQEYRKKIVGTEPVPSR